MRTGLLVFVTVGVLASSLAIASPLVPLESPWTGSISYGNGLGAYGSWSDATTTLSWSVSYTGMREFGYNYTYWLTVPEHAVSHLILETSDNLTLANIRNVTGTFAGDYTWELGTFETGPSNENMPSSIHGIKFELGGDYTTLMFSFDCTRDPVWGDFYARDGKSGDPHPAAVWNLGFTNPDTDPSEALPPGDLDYMYPWVGWHVLTPDTSYSVPTPNETPEPATWVLLGATAIVGVIRKRRNSSV